MNSKIKNDTIESIELIIIIYVYHQYYISLIFHYIHKFEVFVISRKNTKKAIYKHALVLLD